LSAFRIYSISGSLFICLLVYLQWGLLLLFGKADVFGIMGSEQSVKFVTGKFSSVQFAFPSWFKIKG